MDRVEPALVSVGIRPADWWLDPIQVPKLVAGARLLETAMATAQKNSSQFQSAVVHVAEGFETTGHVDQKSVLELAHSMGAWRKAVEEDTASAKALIVASLGKHESFWYDMRFGELTQDRFQ